MRIAPGFAAALALSQTVLGSLYVISPTSQTVCHGGQPCLVQWVDDGVAPLLGGTGPCQVALYAGNQELVQQIEIVDVSTTHSLSFTPRPDAGPNSNTYYVAFTSINSSDPSHPVTAFSPIFALDGMSGSFDSPVPELTSPIPVPSSLLSAHPNQIATSTHGTVSLSTQSSSSLLSSFSANSNPSSSPTSSTSSTSSRPNAAMRQSLPLLTITLIGLSASLLV